MKYISKTPVLKWLAILFILAAFVCGLWVNFGLRTPAEAGDKTVGLMVDYDELKRIADASFEIEFADMLRKAKLSGATGLVVRERILSDWEIAGDVTVFSGGQLRFQVEAQQGQAHPEAMPDIEIKPEKTYILTKDPQVFEQIFSMLDAKRRHPESFEYQGYFGIETSLHSSERAFLGLGYPLARLEEAAAQGYQIIPRIRNWEPVTTANLQEVARWVSMIPNLTAIGFNDQTVPGDGTDPIIQDRLADSLAPLEKPLVSFEFYDQTGLQGIAERLGNEIFRVHAIAENELTKYTNQQDAANRYKLAATERNMRYILLRFQGLINPAASMLDNMELIEFVRSELEAEGLNVGNPELLPEFSIPLPALILLGAGVIAAGAWLFALAAEPFFRKRKWRIPYLILIVLALAAWAAGLIIMPVFARKLFAFACAIVYPSLGIILILQDKGIAPLTRWREARGQPPRLAGCGLALLGATATLVVMSALTMVGAVIMSALLAEPIFMLKLNGFVGVKAAHIVPLALVPLILWLREEDWFGLLSGTVKKSVMFWQLGICLIMLAALAVYIMRTGNDSPETVFSIELTMRQMLQDFLGVRPRTSEFLIGHPLMLVLLYFGYKFSMFPVLMVGIMGQVSLMNTYAHIHTPLLVSLQRSGNGLWLGMLLGVIVIAAIELALLWLRHMNKRRGENLKV